ncbi:hypothetical protein [Shewanella colwelliana]|uniref:hypothetical protein n=1 Tax=Shewanella colwelliana TaxID=23 RepID=UPI00299DC6C4|nr:hypothetical protein [Shewanella colwelliana]MDX1280692.1 hypothetical protein [Shewanella colwelliana]
MKKNLCTLSILLGISSFQLVAAEATSNTFQHDANVNFGTHSEDFGDGIWSLDYRFYFTPVDAQKGPYALAGFLAQHSNIGAMVAQPNTYNNTTMYAIDGAYVLPSNWFIGANYRYTDVDNKWDNISTTEGDNKGYGATIGYYFNEASEVAFIYDNNGSSSWNSEEWPQEITIANDYDETLYGAHIRTFIAMQSFSGLDLKASYNRIERQGEYISTLNNLTNASYNFESTSNQLNLTADWYINPAWSVGASYLWHDFDGSTHYISNNTSDESNGGSSDNIYALSTSYWWQISGTFAAKFSAAKQFGLNNDSADDGIFIGISANARF